MEIGKTDYREDNSANYTIIIFIFYIILQYYIKYKHLFRENRRIQMSKVNKL